MTDYLTLTEFIPGTKAKAQEVNANFALLKDAITQRASIDGDATQPFSVASAQTDNHAVNKKQLNDATANFTSQLNKLSTKFCVKSGNTTNGLGDLFSYSVLRITPKIGGAYPNLTIIDFEGTQSTITSAAEISMTGKVDGTYNLFAKADGTLYTLANNIYKQQKRPALVDGDIWLNTSCEPLNCIKYDGTTDVKFLDVPLAKVVIKNSLIESIKTYPFNQNGYNVNMYSFPEKKYDYANPISKSAGVLYTAESNGLVFANGGWTSTECNIIIEGVTYPIHLSSTQGSRAGGAYPIAKGQTYMFSAGSSFGFVPEITI